jgi:hypothetical protein
MNDYFKKETVDDLNHSPKISITRYLLVNYSLKNYKNDFEAKEKKRW